jgi:uncharacterized membrane protein YagU involved in acid resistance
VDTEPATVAVPAGDLVVGAATAAAGSVAGGVAFGVQMQAGGALPMVAAMIGSTSAIEGWALHLWISLLLGVGFGMLTYRINRSGVVMLAGLAYGILWWVLGGLLLMPLALGAPVLEIGGRAWGSLVGHLLYGILTAAGAALLDRRPSVWGPVRDH